MYGGDFCRSLNSLAPLRAEMKPHLRWLLVEFNLTDSSKLGHFVWDVIVWWTTWRKNKDRLNIQCHYTRGCINRKLTVIDRFCKMVKEKSECRLSFWQMAIYTPGHLVANEHFNWLQSLLIHDLEVQNLMPLQQYHLKHLIMRKQVRDSSPCGPGGRCDTVHLGHTKWTAHILS